MDGEVPLDDLIICLKDTETVHKNINVSQSVCKLGAIALNAASNEHATMFTSLDTDNSG